VDRARSEVSSSSGVAAEDRPASEIERWLRRQAAREQRIVVLEEGLLGDRLWRYDVYRLRYFFLRYLVESAAHAVLVLYLFDALNWDNFVLVAIGFAGTALVSSFWWGALEAMRSQIRDLYRSGKPHRIAEAIGGWLALASILGAVVLVAAIAWIAWRSSDGRLGPADALIASLLLRLALDLPIRCYHSGVYALRRVYKPLAASLAPDLIGLATMLALWPLVGVWAIVVASLLVTAVLAVIDVHYNHRVYYFLGFTPLRSLTPAALRTSLRGTGREFFAAGFSYAIMALDSLVVLALLYRAEADSDAVLVIFLVGPTIRAGFDWARILYFDLKRLELRLFTNLRRRFERHTLELAGVLALLFWGIAAVIATAFLARDLGLFYPVLLAFFLTRALLARAQIQAFSQAAYASVLATGALCVAGFAAVSPAAESETGRLAGVALVAAVTAVLLTQISRSARARGEPGTALLTLEWLRRLGEVHGSVRIGSARVVSAAGPQRLDARTREEGNRWRLAQLAERTARRLGRAGVAAWIGPDRLVWFEPPSGSPRVTPEWLQRASGGLIGEIEEHDCATGEEALFVAGHAGLLGRASEHLLTPVVPVDIEAARKTFAELIPGGVVYSPDEPIPAALAALPGSELRAILADAVAFARDLRVGRRRSQFDVTALCSAGELRMIFVAELQAGRRARGRWRHLVTRDNVRAAIGGEHAHPRAHQWPRLVPMRL
jgi:hypothetical protein